ncbi:MAG: hypothetical protein LDL19_07880 [Thiobacillus sp.]|nr:hypothetical protein [Thiobacillus sp.]
MRLTRVLATAGRIVRALFACLLLAPLYAQAARVTVVLSNDTAPYQEVYQVVSAMLDDTGHELNRQYVASLNAATLNEARLVVAVGTAAADAVAAHPGRAPVLAVLVPRMWFHRGGQARLVDGGRRSASAIYLDQPFERQAQLIRLAFPEVHRVGVLLSTDQSGLVDDIEAALRTQKLALVPALVGEGERLATLLEGVLTEADLLLAVPDPLVWNANTAQSLLLTSYRYRDPVVGYSRSLTRAGALLSLHSSPAQIGRQAAEWVLNAASGPARWPAPSYPAYFSVSINEQVARSLGYVVPTAEELERRMGGER